MPPEGHFPGAPSDWLRYAFSDLELARMGQQPNVLLEGLCFHAQQAAEKALKAVLISKAIAPQKLTTSGYFSIFCHKMLLRHRK